MKNAYICSKPEIMFSIKLLAFQGAPDSLFREGKEKIKALFPGQPFEYYSPDPDMLVFLSGGSEMEAQKYIRKNRFYLLAAFEENNSFAAAVEVKAWLDQQGVDNVLLDLKEDHDRKFIRQTAEIREQLNQLQGKKLGLIGAVSDWLLVSDTDATLLKQKLGINPVKYSWDDVPDFRNEEPDSDFVRYFNDGPEEKILDAARVHSALNTLVKNESLDALTVECFSLVKNHKVTACLSLSKFNDGGMPAGCEGDLVSITGMMLAQALTGRIPWMANLIKVSYDCVRFAHCTAPTSLLDGFEIDTHYETGEGTAISGNLASEEVTVFRLNNELNQAFVAEGKVISTHHSQHACRTQIEVNIPKEAARMLKEHPLGNHHLIIPGLHHEKIMMACRIKGIEMDW